MRSEYADVDWSDGRLTFKPNGTSASEIVAELSLLLTDGRLNPNATAVIAAAHEAEVNQGTCESWCEGNTADWETKCYAWTTTDWS